MSVIPPPPPPHQRCRYRGHHGNCFHKGSRGMPCVSDFLASLPSSGTSYSAAGLGGREGAWALLLNAHHVATSLMHIYIVHLGVKNEAGLRKPGECVQVSLCLQCSVLLIRYQIVYKNQTFKRKMQAVMAVTWRLRFSSYLLPPNFLSFLNVNQCSSFYSLPFSGRVRGSGASDVSGNRWDKNAQVRIKFTQLSSSHRDCVQVSAEAQILFVCLHKLKRTLMSLPNPVS